MKQIVIAGRLGKDAELRRTQDGTAVLNFTVAVDDGYGERKGTLWFDCSLFGKRGEALEPHLSKGNAVTVSGDLGKREHDGKTYLTVRVSELTMQGGGEKRETTPKQDRSTSYDRDDARTHGGRDLDDQIPFAPEWR
jgi:single-strand DNA-binding protein